MPAISSAKTTAKPLEYVRLSKPLPSDEKRYARAEMPVDVAMEEPGARVVGRKADGDVVVQCADTNHVAEDWILVVVRERTRAAHDGERML